MAEELIGEPPLIVGINECGADLGRFSSPLVCAHQDLNQGMGVVIANAYGDNSHQPMDIGTSGVCSDGLYWL